jgi:two-component system NtrC family sensor kinase
MRNDLRREMLITSIEDTGHGISEENLGRIFDPFFTTKNQELNGVAGTGLGLSVSYGIIQNHGGQIKVQSTVERGTLFTIELPVVKRLPEQACDGMPEEEVTTA